MTTPQPTTNPGMAATYLFGVLFFSYLVGQLSFGLWWWIAFLIQWTIFANAFRFFTRGSK